MLTSGPPYRHETLVPFGDGKISSTSPLNPLRAGDALAFGFGVAAPIEV
jgi:hypothetical protein